MNIFNVHAFLSEPCCIPHKDTARDAPHTFCIWISCEGQVGKCQYVATGDEMCWLCALLSLFISVICEIFDKLLPIL